MVPGLEKDIKFGDTGDVDLQLNGSEVALAISYTDQYGKSTLTRTLHASQVLLLFKGHGAMLDGLIDSAVASMTPPPGTAQSAAPTQSP